MQLNRPAPAGMPVADHVAWLDIHQQRVKRQQDSTRNARLVAQEPCEASEDMLQLLKAAKLQKHPSELQDQIDQP
jgi:hypothetical protein